METLPFTYDSICQSFSTLAAQSSAVQYTTLGKSLCGRPIPLILLGQGAHSVLFVSTHHGCEWLTAGLLLAFAKEYAAAFQAEKNICSINISYLFHTRSICLVPVLNPDGMVLSQTGADAKNPLATQLLTECGTDAAHYRGNGRGVDLNRNYDAEFAQNTPSSDISSRCNCGMHPESEPETAALCAFIRSKAPFDLLLSLHTAGEEIYWDYRGHAGSRGKCIAQVLSRLSGYPLASPPPQSSAGGLKDWYQATFHAPAFTLECGKGATPVAPTALHSMYQQLRRTLFTAAVLL